MDNVVLTSNYLSVEMQYPKVLHKFLLHVLASIGSCTFSTLVFKQKDNQWSEKLIKVR